MARRKKNQKPNAEYELRPYKGKAEVRVMSFDPGSRNMGIACVGMKDNRLGVLANSVMTNPINDLVNFNAIRPAFFEEVDRWFAAYKPQAIIAERFQTRGLGGPLIEMVSVMLGMLAGRYNVPVLFITAATWKNDYQRRYNIDLKETYKEILIQPHQLDACLIGCYGIEVGRGENFDCAPGRIIGLAEERSCLPLKRKRKE